MKAIMIQGRRWRDSNGNTYHTATAYVDGVKVVDVGRTYGYGDSFEYSAAKAMEDAGMMPGREHYKNGGNEAPWRYWERNGAKYLAEVIDVPRKKDL